MDKRTTRTIELILLVLILVVVGAVVFRLVRPREPVYTVFEAGTPNADALGVTIPDRPHSIWDYLEEPSAVRRTRSFEITTNSLGFRGPEVTAPKPAGRLRVACVGDCVAFGSGVDHHETYPHLLGELLSRRYPERDFEVVNAGMAGADPERILRRLTEKIPAIEPDVVIFAPGAQTSFLPCHTSGAPARVMLADSEYEELMARYRTLLNGALAQSQAQGFRLALVTPTFTSFFLPDGQLWVDEMNAFAEQHALPILDSTALFVQAEARDGLVFSEQNGMQRVTRYRDGQGELLVEVEFQAADRHIAPEIFAWLDDNPGVGQLSSIDGNHANTRGHQMIASELADLLERSSLLER